MMRKTMVAVMATVCCISLHAMKEPERGSLVELRRQHDGRRFQSLLPRQVKPVIQSINENSFMSGIQYKVVFSTGKIILCTHWFHGLSGAPEYNYREEARGGRLLSSLSGHEAAVLFERYKSLYEHMRQK